MSATQQRCFWASASTHAALLLLVILTPALSRHENREISHDEMIMTITSETKLIESTTQQSGNPELTKAPDLPKNVDPPTPPPEPARLETKPLPHEPEPEPPVHETPKPKPENRVKISDKVVHTEEPDRDAPKIKQKKPKQDDKRTSDEETPSRTVRTTDVVKRAKEDPAARKAKDEEVRAAQDAERLRNERLAAAENSRKKWQMALSGAANSLSSKFAPGTQIDMPGPEREAFGPYFVYLHHFYTANWKRPIAISESQASVGAEITIERDGTLKDFRIVSPSGIREMDESVREVLSRYRKLRELPAGTDSEKTFTIRFTLTADSPT